MKKTNACAPVLGVLGALVAFSAGADGPTTLPEVSVTGTREAVPLSETPAAVGLVKGETVKLDRPTHPAQIISQIPGAAVAITNGEGHTTAIRHPFTTNPVYLFLEDGIPSRSTGFFNHNALYEINIPQAGGIEVTRGPGTALYGSDAIGGIINVLTRTPPAGPEFSVSAEAGYWGWRRVLLDGGTLSGDDAWRGSLNVTETDGWRYSTGYERQGGTFRWDRALASGASLKTVLSFSNVDQQTGANSPLIRADYENDPRRNYKPIAFRKVQALRLSAAWEKEDADTLLTITPYFRDDSMDLLASFALAFDPTVYNTSNQSFGVMAKWRKDFAPLRTRFIAGVDLDVSPGGREENSLNLTTRGAGATREFLAYTVGTRIYDYDVTFKGVSPYVHGEISPTDQLRLSAGLRYDHLSYDFDNNISAANVVAGGGTYGQVGDRSITYTHFSPKLGATYALGAETSVFAAYNHGFRAPSEGQIFRPSRSAGTNAAAAAAAAALVQSAVGLRPIKVDQIELGLRGSAAGVSYDVVLYNLVKRDDILSARDTTTNFTVTENAGKTRHHGIEIGLGAPLGSQFRVDAAWSYAEHRYQKWESSQGVFTGNEIEAAPRVMANTRLTWSPREGARVQLEWVRLGRYWLDAANTDQYEGHDLLNLRLNWPVSKDLSLFGSVQNLEDERYADSAQIGSGVPNLSPGLPRTVFAGIEARW